MARTRNGFTLIEFLVVIGLIGLMAAISIPAVQHAREAARRANCGSNLRQIGIAMNAYVALVGSFPQMNNGGKAFSPQTMILSHIENSTIFNSINFNVRPSESANFTVANMTINLFICPSDYRTGSWSSYACSTGHGYQVYRQFNGIFVKKPVQPITPAGVVDGLSNTAMSSEWVLGSGTRKEVAESKSVVYFTKGRLTAPHQYDSFLELCAKMDSVKNPKVTPYKGRQWIKSDFGSTIYNHNMIINGNSCYNGRAVFEGAWTASSRHRSGAHCLFADGHIRFLRDSIDLTLWRAIGTRAGDEKIDESQY